MKLTGDLQSAKLIYLKGFLFLVTGLLSAAALLLDSPTLRTAFLLAIAVWSFCRLYYFLFYVIEKYVDPGFKFAGLYSFLLYLLRRGPDMTPDTVETVIRRHFMLEMRLDLSSVDTRAFAAVAGRLEDLGLAVSTLQQERAADPEAEDRAYHCHMACRLGQPPTELRQEPIPFARWLEGAVTGPDALPDAYFLAKAGEEYVSVCLLHRAAGAPHLVSGFTGTLPDWGGKGIAKALKAHALLQAIRQGYHSVETSNLQVNRGICTINRALGFQVFRRYLHTYAIPVEATG